MRAERVGIGANVRCRLTISDSIGSNTTVTSSSLVTIGMSICNSNINVGRDVFAMSCSARGLSFMETSFAATGFGCSTRGGSCRNAIGMVLDTLSISGGATSCGISTRRSIVIVCFEIGYGVRSNIGATTAGVTVIRSSYVAVGGDNGGMSALNTRRGMGVIGFLSTGNSKCMALISIA